MKRRFTILSVIMLVFLFAGCTKKASKLYEKGNYEKAYNAALKKYEKGKKTSASDVKLLENAYAKVLLEEKESLEIWRASTNEDKWENIFYTLERVQDRQNAIEPYLPIKADNGYKAKIELMDVSEEKLDAAEKAASISYEKGLADLNEYEDYRTKNVARSAYNHFLKVNNFAPGYEDVDDLIQDAKFLGTTNVLVDFDNNSVNYLPYEFRRDMDRLLDVRDETWIKYDNTAIAGVEYDYRITLDIRDVDVRPSNSNTNEQTYSKEIEDYRRDSDGNFILDADGKKIREDRTITARVRRTVRTKSLSLDMQYRLRDERTFRELDRRRFQGNSSFRDESCNVSGDDDALPSGFNCSQRQPAEFPTDEEMLEEAFDDFRNELRRRINNDYYID